jgi:hypothetical protein
VLGDDVAGGGLSICTVAGGDIGRGPAEAPLQATQQVTPTSQPREIAIRTGLADTLAPRQARRLAAHDSAMSRAAMTTDLDDVRWSDLQHNYGPAGDVPALTRRLRDGRSR